MSGETFLCLCSEIHLHLNRTKIEQIFFIPKAPHKHLIFFFNRHRPFEEETANMIPAERINTQRRNEIVIPEKVFAPPKECSLFYMSWLLLWGKQKNLFEAEQWNQNTIPHRAPINSLGINTLPYHSITICVKHSSGHHLNPDCKRAWKSYRFS